VRRISILRMRYSLNWRHSGFLPTRYND